MTKRAVIQQGAFLVSGVWLGVVASLSGVSDYGEVREMTTLTNLRLFAVFAAAVSVSMLCYSWFTRGRNLSSRPIHKGTVPGALLFGVGWAMTGACPVITAVQIGEGQGWALYSLGGILLGMWAYGPVHRRFFRWSPGACDM